MKPLKTSFTIYKRNPDKDNFKPKEYELKDVTVSEYHRANLS